MAWKIYVERRGRVATSPSRPHAQRIGGAEAMQDAVSKDAALEV